MLGDLDALVVGVAMRLLALLLALGLAGCGDAPTTKPMDDYEISSSEDGWLYISNVTSGKILSRFRVKGKHTTFEDFDWENFNQ